MASFSRRNLGRFLGASACASAGELPPLPPAEMDPTPKLGFALPAPIGGCVREAPLVVPLAPAGVAAAATRVHPGGGATTVARDSVEVTEEGVDEK